MRHPLAVLAALIAVPVLTAVVGCSGDDRGEVPTPRGTPTAPGSAGPPAQRSAPPLQVEVVTRGLEHGWDIGFLPDGSALVSERPGRITLVSSLRPGATTARVGADLSDVFAQGEGGLLGLVVHPDFATSRRFTTCQNHHEKGRPFDIRLVTWRLADDSAPRFGSVTC